MKMMSWQTLIFWGHLVGKEVAGEIRGRGLLHYLKVLFGVKLLASASTTTVSTALLIPYTIQRTFV